MYILIYIEIINIQFFRQRGRIIIIIIVMIIVMSIFMIIVMSIQMIIVYERVCARLNLCFFDV